LVAALPSERHFLPIAPTLVDHNQLSRIAALQLIVGVEQPCLGVDRGLV
jgi:hypothetical protein